MDKEILDLWHSHHKLIIELNDNYSGLFRDTAHLEERINDLENISAEKRLIALEKYMNSWSEPYPVGGCESCNKKPYKCPVCEGKGIKPPYAQGGVLFIEQTCNACEGKGIVWG